MRLLVVTQKVAKNDHALGFFHRWIEEFAQKFESVIVVCLEEGEHHLPANVRVLSLGKERGVSKLGYVVRFYKYIWGERNNYDGVFVHMNQEYVVLGGLLWKLWGKKVSMWRNHVYGNFLTRLAVFWSDKVFYTSPNSYTATFSKAKIMPAGVNLEHFKPTSMPVENNRILVLGRISPVKRLDVIVDGLKELELKGVDYRADIIGDTLPQNIDYAEMLLEKIRKSGISHRVRILPAVDYAKAPELYREYKLLVNLTLDGSLDKTIFESLASGLKVVIANSFFREWLPATWVLKSPSDTKELGESLGSVLADSHNRNSETQSKISILLKEHSLKNLMDHLMRELA